jgi:DNA-binding NarL/FixJ family response regulator
MSASESQPLDLLSSREHQVAALICSGLSNKLIADRLDLTEGTVKQHVQEAEGAGGLNKRSDERRRAAERRSRKHFVSRSRTKP